MENLRLSAQSQLLSLARCHQAAFPRALSSALGRSYLKNMLSWYLSTDKAFLFHIEKEPGLCAGYCGGIIVDGTLPTGSASAMAQYSFKAAIRAFALRPWLLFHPEVRAKWPLLWKNLLMKLGLRTRVHFSPGQKTTLSRDPHIGLVVIGVDPAYQSQGYGSLLLQEFERRAVEDYGIRKLKLTVKADNAQAICAYERNGWQRGSVSGESLQMFKIMDIPIQDPSRFAQRKGKR